MKDPKSKKKKWKTFIIGILLILLARFTLYGFSLYLRRNAILKESIEKQVAVRYPSVHFELGSASLVYGKGIGLKEMKGAEAASPQNPIGEVQDLFLECPITIINLLRKKIAPTSLKIDGVLLRLPSVKLLKGTHLKFQKKLSGKIQIPVEITGFQMIFQPEHGKKDPISSQKIEIRFYPAGSSDEKGFLLKSEKIIAKTADPLIPIYNGPISKQFDDWLLKTVP
ncbi:MAG: hypothetical protein Q4G69_07755 [Planctomycetia bacterium]|nr:hypothetical protein [Planctomycetia bacterium]